MAFIAKPKINNWIDSKKFETAKQAQKYLEQYTEERMHVKDWILIEKIIEVGNVCTGDGECRACSGAIASFC